MTTLITEKFVAELIIKAKIDPALCNFEEARLVLYCDAYGLNERDLIGCRLETTCSSPECVNPEHVKVIPAVEH